MDTLFNPDNKMLNTLFPYFNTPFGLHCSITPKKEHTYGFNQNPPND